MKLNNYLKYLEYFSLICVDNKKIPVGPWKKQQTEKFTPKEFESQFNNPKTEAVGIVTGFEDLEVIDIDLKVLSTTKEKTDFWEEFTTILRDVIFDFDEKFVIYKTMNAGYHILYKSKRVEKCKKIAKLKGHTEAIIETRGVGGYVFMYPENQVSKLSYFDIKYISDADREELFKLCLSYNYEEPKIEKPKPQEKKTYSDGITPWDDFNNKTTVWDVVQSDFTVYRDTPKKTFIKRLGAKSAYSGYIFKDDNRMYLHSTGTIYPATTQISPYYAFVIKYHNGDFSAAAKDLYDQGFGERITKKIKDAQSRMPDIRTELKVYEDNKVEEFPIEIFPDPFQSYILECNRKLDSVIDYMGCTLLWVVSVCAGNRFKIKIKTGWDETAVVWFALVGSAGIGKSPSIKRILYPLVKENNRMIKNYIKKRKEFDEYEKLTKKEKEREIEINEPVKEQFIADDITLEALVDLHDSVNTGVGVFKDELAGWLKDMNKYREGSDLEFWLSTWSGSSVSLNRVTRRGSFVENPFIPVIGGIQPDILHSLFTQDKKDNGFMDRMLISYPSVSVPFYNEEEISEAAIEWYNSTVTKLKRSIEVMAEGLTDKIECVFSDEAKKLWVQKFNEITAIQNSDEENEYFKSMYPKQKSYIPRFAFLLNVLWSLIDANDVNVIEKKAMEGAIKLSDYFVTTAKKMKFENLEVESIKKLITKGQTTKDKVFDAYKINPKFNKSQLANILGVSRRTIYNCVAEIEKENKKKTK